MRSRRMSGAPIASPRPARQPQPADHAAHLRSRRHAKVVIRLAATGATNTYTIPWLKIGIPIPSQGPLPSPVRGNGRIFLVDRGQDITAGLPGSAAAGRLFKFADIGTADDTLPAYMDPIRPLLNASVSKDYYSVLDLAADSPSSRRLRDSSI